VSHNISIPKIFEFNILLPFHCTINLVHSNGKSISISTSWAHRFHETRHKENVIPYATRNISYKWWEILGFLKYCTFNIYLFSSSLKLNIDLACAFVTLLFTSTYLSGSITVSFLCLIIYVNPSVVGPKFL